MMMRALTTRTAVKMGLRHRLGRCSNPGARRPLVFEPLEDRTLLAAIATLNINNTVGSPTKGLLTYTGSAAVTDGLTVKTSTVITNGAEGYSTLMYTFTSDSSETITLESGALADGWTGSGTSTVTGPGSVKTSTTTTYVSSVSITLQSGNDTATISSVGATTSLIFDNNPGNTDAVTLGGAGGAQNISGNLSITNVAGTTALTVNDSGDTTPRTVFVSGTQIANLEPSLIFFGAANLSDLTIIGANALGTLNVNANDQGPVTVTGGSATGSGTIAIGSDVPINYSDFLAVNVSNEADQPLTQVSQTVTTTTGATPTPGTAVTYFTSTFADEDLQAKTANLVASIDWGDGTTPTAGTITADGVGLFQVTGTHTYAQTGSYSVVTTITDLGTTDTLSISGIAVTISDVGGSALTTGSVAQVGLVSNSSSIPAGGTDPNLVNPWGITLGELGFAWVADEGSGYVTAYASPNGTTPQEPPVVIPPAAGGGKGSPTGIVSNDTPSFAINGQPSAFLFATLDGTISGWNGLFPSSGSPTAVITLNNATAGAVYTGLAIANDGNQNLLYVANFHTGQIEVYNSQFQPVSTSNDPDWTLLTNTFTNPDLPAGYAPYNVQNIGGNLYVTFAKQGTTAGTAVAQLGDGFVDEFTPDGILIQQLIPGAPLDAPWGVALAPSDFGQYSGDLIVANTGNGQINAFNPTTGQSLGAFADITGAPLVNDGLYGLMFTASSEEFLEFTAAPDGDTSGLIGSLSPTPESVTVVPAPVTAAVTNITAFVAQPFNGVVATFTDTDSLLDASDFTATVDWGDGSSNTSADGTGTVTITKTNATGTTYLVTGIHTYAGGTTGQPPDILTITIAQNSTSNSVIAEGTATISDPTLHVTLSGITAIADEAYDGPVATFTDDAPDPNLSDYSATINWGDGTTTAGTISLANQAGQGYIVTGVPGHVYTTATTGQAPDVVTVTVTKTATDSLGNPLDESGEAEGNVAVTSPTLHVTVSGFSAVAGSPTVTAGTSYVGQVATFTDDAPDPNLGDYSATINWGDGTTTAGTISLANQAGQGYIVTGSHAYTTPTTGLEPFVIQVTVTKTTEDAQGNPLIESATGIGNAPVADALMYPVNQGNLAAAIEGLALTNVLVGQFFDANPYYTAAAFNGAFAPLISWGDGKTSLGIVVADAVPQVFDVFGSHIYTVPTAAGVPNTISIAVTDAGGAKTTITNNVVVLAAPLTFTSLALPINFGTPITEGKSFTSDVSLFTSANAAATAGEYSATINWGDPTSTVLDLGTIKEDGNGVFHITGTHTYLNPGTYVITVTVLVTGGATFTNALSSITVTDAPIQFTPPNQPIAKYVSGATITAPPPAAPPGLPLTIPLGTLTDTDPNSVSGLFTITINWGDGGPGGAPGAGSVPDFLTGTITATTLAPSPIGMIGQNYSVTGMHTYMMTGNFTVVVTITDSFGSTTTGTFSVSVTAVASPLALAVKKLFGLDYITAGQPFTDQVAEFESADPDATASDFGATIDWGDETSANPSPDTTAGTIVQGANDPDTGYPTFYVVGTHIYDEANDPANPYYTFTVSVSSAGNPPISGSGEAFAYAPELITQSAPIAGTEGQPLPSNTSDGTVVATFTDPEFMDDPQDFTSGTTATIDWGDGSGPDSGTVRYLGTSAVGTEFEVTGTHTYSDSTGASEDYQVTVTIETPDGSAAVVDDQADITAAGTSPAPTPTPPSSITTFSLGTVSVLTAGNPFTEEVASFSGSDSSETASDFSATIDWGDGSLSAGTVIQGANASSDVPTFFVVGAHTYDTPGSYTFTVDVSTPGYDPTSDTGSAIVSAAPLIAQSAPISGTQGEALSDVVVATFTDTAPISDPDGFAGGTIATINWGDGTGPDDGTVSYEGTSPAGTVFVVTGSHTYSNVTDVFEAFQATISIDTPTGSSAVVADFVDMTVPVLTDPAFAVQATAGSAFTVPVATIHTTVQQATAADFTATIAWGDGQTSSGTLQPEGGGTFEVLGSHVYATPGSFPISISLSDSQGNTVSDSTTATVSAPHSPQLASPTDVQAILNKRDLVSQILVTFPGPVDATEARRVGLYHLTAAPKGGSSAARNAQTIAIRSAVYDAADDTVILIPRNPFTLTKRVQLQVAGNAPTGLKGIQAATSDGRSRADAVAVQLRVGTTRLASTVHATEAGKPTNPALIDALLDQGQLSDLTTSLHPKRGARLAHRRE